MLSSYLFAFPLGNKAFQTALLVYLVYILMIHVQIRPCTCARDCCINGNCLSTSIYAGGIIQLAKWFAFKAVFLTLLLSLLITDSLSVCPSVCVCVRI